MKTSDSADSSTNKAGLSLKTLISVLGHPVRWKILTELSENGPLLVSDLASICGVFPDVMSKHLAVMRKAEVVRAGHARLYHLTDSYKAMAEKGELDFGYCVVRVGFGETGRQKRK